MKATLNHKTTNVYEMAKIFQECNKEYFNNELPTPTFAFFSSKKIVGRYTAIRNFLGLVYHSQILLSTYYDFSDKRFLKDTILHEMIHYYIAYKNIGDNKTHGENFQYYMNKINKQGNRNITIYAENVTLIKKVESNLIIFFDNEINSNILIKVGKKYVSEYIKNLSTYFKHIDENKSVYVVKTNLEKYAAVKANQNGLRLNYKIINETILNELINNKDNLVYTASLTEYKKLIA